VPRTVGIVRMGGGHDRRPTHVRSLVDAYGVVHAVKVLDWWNGKAGARDERSYKAWCGKNIKVHEGNKRKLTRDTVTCFTCVLEDPGTKDDEEEYAYPRWAAKK
jgi:hypothetical protein